MTSLERAFWHLRCRLGLHQLVPGIEATIVGYNSKGDRFEITYVPRTCRRCLWQKRPPLGFRYQAGTLIGFANQADADIFDDTYGHP